MTDHSIRLFATDEAVRRIGEELLHRTLPKAEWTHEAHLAACVWLLLERPDIAPERDLPDIIRAYNVSVGGVNNDAEGYHETLTRLYIHAVHLTLAGRRDPCLVAAVNAVLSSPIAQRDWPLRFYSREYLFGVAARRSWAEPDLGPICIGAQAGKGA
ncbi:hypothetical protein [Novosphingobium sp.]|uniref:hypothetical protein n=1 Tax=Novosphingobium sp. TaxID=1874826 RepID=UPI0025E36942|nr:hypothetical protein [Novosphingobium sp.]